MRNTRLSIIIPCYYNEENLPHTWEALRENEKLFPANLEAEYVFVDDGSGDKTYEVLCEIHRQCPQRVRVIKLAGNVGAFNAMFAGLEHASGDVHVFIMADLQDPPALMVDMYAWWQKGIRVIIGNRADRQEKGLARWYSNTFHRLVKKYALSHVPEGGFDYVMFDNLVREQILNIREPNTNIFYLISWLNFPYVSIPYVRQKRDHGRSKWTFRKKVKAFIDTFVGFSFAPIRLITITGGVLGILALITTTVIAVARIAGWIDVQGWSSLMVVVLFVSAIQMISLGIIGEYVWRTLDASRKRPLYVADKKHLTEESATPEKE
jgi:dolichol-phosphate mannosyltransferase